PHTTPHTTLFRSGGLPLAHAVPPAAVFVVVPSGVHHVGVDPEVGGCCPQGQYPVGRGIGHEGVEEVVVDHGHGHVIRVGAAPDAPMCGQGRCQGLQRCR